MSNIIKDKSYFGLEAETANLKAEIAVRRIESYLDQTTIDL